MISLAAQRIAAGSGETLELGDISVEKEWTFAGDVAEAMFTLVSQDSVFEAVIGSGVTYSIQDWLARCFSLVGRDWREHVHIRGDFVPEYSRLVSDPATMRSLGWSPRTGLPELARLMMVP
jgi:GDPmannose 4,6-dehydratase